MDAAGMVSLAKNWSLVPEQATCFPPSPYDYQVIPAGDSITVEMEADCSDVKSMEHVRCSD